MSGKEDTWEGLFWKSHKYNERVKIKSGTYLNSFCPHCEKELTAENVLLLEATDKDGNVGKLELSPYLNSFDRKTDIHLPEGRTPNDLSCPHCHKSLVIPDKQCGSCESGVASFLVGSSNAKVPFFICMKIGCPWHALSSEHENQIILDDSDEW